MTAKIVIMDVTINYMLSLGKENELNLVLDDSILKEFEKMDNKGDFTPVHYVVLNEQDEGEKK